MAEATAAAPAAPAPVFFVSHGGSIVTAIGSTAFGPFTEEAEAMVTATRLATRMPAQVYGATLLTTAAPPAPKPATTKPALAAPASTAAPAAKTGAPAPAAASTAAPAAPKA